ncbi:MAG: type II toxin-antitoxin system ParD family antitoxin [Verrucomicrobia bacterium]|nr:type II toxin-antitoxin system ParD family antitoxin [Verrucomicrobiota bacterium]
MNVSLTPKLEKWVQSKVSSGYYNSSSEVVREALRIMAEYEQERRNRIKSLRSDVLVGLHQSKRGKVIRFDKSELKKIKQEAKAGM